VGAFVPLVAGLYWKRATSPGAVCSSVLGLLPWLALLYTPAGEIFPPQLGGVLAAALGMIAGTLAPQRVRNVQGPVYLASLEPTAR